VSFDLQGRKSRAARAALYQPFDALGDGAFGYGVECAEGRELMHPSRLDPLARACDDRRDRAPDE
jgi:hypothetical protein